MNFTPENAAKVLRGEKTMTCRRHCAYVIGRDYAVCPGRGKKQIGRLVVERVIMYEQARDAITNYGDAYREGYASPYEWLADYERLNGKKSLDLPTYRIEFQLMEESK